MWSRLNSNCLGVVFTSCPLKPLMNFRVPWKVWMLLASWGIFNLSKGVSSDGNVTVLPLGTNTVETRNNPEGQYR
jgi:hypothetical protein